VGTIPDYVYEKWPYDVDIELISDAEWPGVTAADDRFMDYVDLPVAGKVSKNGFKSQKNLKFAEHVLGDSPPPRRA
jgi:hypothetical protein